MKWFKVEQGGKEYPFFPYLRPQQVETREQSDFGIASLVRCFSQDETIDGRQVPQDVALEAARLVVETFPREGRVKGWAERALGQARWLVRGYYPPIPGCDPRSLPAASAP